jgi:hypothetical protein
MLASAGFMREGPYTGVAIALFVLVGCGKASGVGAIAKDDAVALAQARTGCGHTACGDNFFVDAASTAPCSPGATCATTLTLVATGAFHINDEYPYKFKADDSSAVTFLGTDGAGKNVFSKLANDWRKNDEKTGAMTVKWRPSDGAVKSDAEIGGIFKLSVCSAQACQLEQVPLKATVAVR